GAHDSSVRGNGAFRCTGSQRSERPCAIRTLGRSDMHFVAAERDTVVSLARNAFQPFVAAQLGVDLKKPKTLGQPCPALYAARIANGAAQHLISAAEAKDCAAAAMMRQDVDVKAGCPQRGEAGNGGFRSGQNDQICVARKCRTRSRANELDVRLSFQRIEIIEIGDVWKYRHGYANSARGLSRAFALKVERILRRQSPR